MMTLFHKSAVMENEGQHDQVDANPVDAVEAEITATVNEAAAQFAKAEGALAGLRSPLTPDQERVVSNYVGANDKGSRAELNFRWVTTLRRLGVLTPAQIRDVWDDIKEVEEGGLPVLQSRIVALQAENTALKEQQRSAQAKPTPTSIASRVTR